ncbi:MAG: hypothetical protein IKN62_05590 [Elusimicrobia bacterium]|nr:hypothetical protein [Elusimicrobiota bacterium]
MTLEQKIECIFDEVEDMQLSEDEAKIYIDGAKHGMQLCYPNQIQNITQLFDKILAVRKKVIII